jgi:integrase
MIYKKGRYFMTKFMWEGKVIRKSTRATDRKLARAIEGKIRSELARGNFGILETRVAPTLAEFLKREFLPYAEARFQATPKTRNYYFFGARSLLNSGLAKLRLDEITDQHAGQYTARLLGHLKPTTANCGLRTLRRALSLAVEWGELDRRPKISLAKGERQRERVLTDSEAERYLAACPQPWRAVATVMLGSGMRPGECYALRWEHVLLNGQGGLIQIAQGKSKAARRLLPMVPAVYQALKARHEAQGLPREGWVFPTGSRSGHLEESTAKIQHARALRLSGVKPFEPYCLRHTALTRLAESGCDAFTLARIAGHSSITITQRYCHPQADAIERAFQKLSGGLVTDGGHLKKLPAEGVAPEVTTSLADSMG